jgi:hypothetical protein
MDGVFLTLFLFNVPQALFAAGVVHLSFDAGRRVLLTGLAAACVLCAIAAFALLPAAISTQAQWVTVSGIVVPYFAVVSVASWVLLDTAETSARRLKVGCMIAAGVLAPVTFLFMLYAGCSAGYGCL